MYLELTIVATSKQTEIWLGDNEGHFVQKVEGALKTHLLPGEYVVEFGLGSATYPVSLTSSRQYTQSELEDAGSCPRPAVKLQSEV